MPCPIEEIRWPSTVTEADLTRCRTAEATHISYWLLGPGEIALRAPFMVKCDETNEGQMGKAAFAEEAGL